ncbi:MAG: hypothetical protein A2233_03620 [Candidatus Kerfeldbacteria bacterium RIFOXYA2_FULL_38_24]|uniref:Glycerophosphoryl diester phosphodiesterase membrane domain-containing protein n=1 Tax=Candidatus Kerfeldbacteria bacterium RIFOXYB2_FULL_38_14 TaxID=1798547 RepID=A0A1G2BE61_9BACT|nr:MAG: hypothetical protein A2233_03620 [Candidatus Kerfeldbacteria bacterium RIFOXYA2_FULL_38_24]OGY87518.1 MAG: hypothetical protein A2319_04115 [Candidatus Kerfeldbacteria bacterium RIFOXYB2_FULL_38_14]OGY90502.1 MAG: hypothetical protein A2458_04710 [Candidatus Kerfeldbacteria bacterium RIFOXYC2_FULL_38_9]
MKLYKKIFRQSWEITKTHKSLWIFGFFVLFWGGKGIDLELFFTQSALLGSNNSPFQPQFWQMDRLGEGWHLFISSPTPILMIIALITCVAFLIGIIMISQIGLIEAFDPTKSKINNRKKYSLEQAIKTSEHHILPVLEANMLGRGVAYGLLLLSALPLFFLPATNFRLVLSLLLFLFLVIITIVVSLVTKYAVNALVLENLTLGKAFHRAWNIFSKNIGISLELAFMMFITFFLINIFDVLVSVVVTLPLGIMFSAIFSAVTAYYIYNVLLLVTVFLVTVVSVVLFSTWHFGNWTLLFSELTKGQKKAKIHRLLKGE